MSDGYAAKVVADSISGAGVRLVTKEVTFPRFILPEFNTHRVFSRNSASSRAIPVIRQLSKVLAHPFVPAQFGTDQPGMQAGGWLAGEQHEEAVEIWLSARNSAVVHAAALLLGRQHVSDFLKNPSLLDIEEERVRLLSLVDSYRSEVRDALKNGQPHRYLNVHKQSANRLIEPFGWHTVLVTSTEWNNFWALRDSEMAQPEIRTIARLAHKAFDYSVPDFLYEGQWHLPLIQPDEMHLAEADPEKWRQISAGRCARVSYETHNGVRDIEADIALCHTLASNGHMSPMEHVATPDSHTNEDGSQNWHGNFYGWKQWRKTFPHESNFGEVLATLA